MSDYRIISADSHVMEPADLWTTRIESRFRDRAPRVVSLEDGDFWYWEGQRVLGVQGAGSNRHAV